MGIASYAAGRGLPELKERHFEQGELGYSLDYAKEHLGVCPDCIADDGLQRFVAGNGPVERCGFCGGSGPQGLDLGALFRYMAVDRHGIP